MKNFEKFIYNANIEAVKYILSGCDVSDYGKRISVFRNDRYACISSAFCAFFFPAAELCVDYDKLPKMQGSMTEQIISEFDTTEGREGTKELHKTGNIKELKRWGKVAAVVEFSDKSGNCTYLKADFVKKFEIFDKNTVYSYRKVDHNRPSMIAFYANGDFIGVCMPVAVKE